MKLKKQKTKRLNDKPHFFIMRQRMAYPQRQEATVIPFYVPVQPSTNACSHCFIQPSTKEVAFYTYPCQRQHLAHESCFQHYLQSNIWERGCQFCVKEYGISITQPEKELQEHKSTLRYRIIGFVLLLVLVIGGSIFLVGFQERWW